jgi:hypothetical protein
MGAPQLATDREHQLKIFGSLKRGLQGYGLNPRDWTLDWTQSEVTKRSEDGESEIIENILIRSREDGDVMFAGHVYNSRRPGENVNFANWISVAATDWSSTEK